MNITIQKVSYTREQMQGNLDSATALLKALDLKEVSPRSIIGTGYVNPRKSAYEYLNRQIGGYKMALMILDGQEGK